MSTLGDVMSTSGCWGMFSTSGDRDACGDTMSTLGGYHGYIGGYHDACGGIL